MYWSLSQITFKIGFMIKQNVLRTPEFPKTPVAMVLTVRMSAEKKTSLETSRWVPCSLPRAASVWAGQMCLLHGGMRAWSLSSMSLWIWPCVTTYSLHSRLQQHRLEVTIWNISRIRLPHKLWNMFRIMLLSPLTTSILHSMEHFYIQTAAH